MSGSAGAGHSSSSPMSGQGSIEEDQDVSLDQVPAEVQPGDTNGHSSTAVSKLDESSAKNAGEVQTETVGGKTYITTGHAKAVRIKRPNKKKFLSRQHSTTSAASKSTSTTANPISSGSSQHEHEVGSSSSSSSSAQSTSNSQNHSKANTPECTPVRVGTAGKVIGVDDNQYVKVGGRTFSSFDDCPSCQQERNGGQSKKKHTCIRSKEGREA